MGNLWVFTRLLCGWSCSRNDDDGVELAKSLLHHNVENLGRISMHFKGKTQHMGI